ncbi:FAD:protein FMN transferase [Colwellia sp. RSH04]|uniref:FAD:protein FMN transferase n=1 Tax=Colwellia sp. RSH04 TaxID=2305464 RepID=UPI000E586B6B|nr:FAD:protein FMN transferase [Colwellia sp. RSH04]RHW75195.1 FAD:protein FMN transferase [Colwellia sp. RSH04]
MTKIKLLLLIIMTVVVSGCFPSNKSGKAEILLQGRTMGTTYNVKVVSTLEHVKSINLQQQIDDALKQVNQEMSTYIPSSEISQFNQSRTTEERVISEGFSRVLAESLRLGEMSHGKLDITVGPLVNLWGFGPEFRPEKVPSAALIAQTKAQTGLDNLSLTGNKLAKAKPELAVDLSTIAKGYGVDVVAELIEANGFTNYLVEIGGELRLKGVKSTGELWVVAIEKPITTERSVQQFIVPKDNAMATSGDYRNYFEEDGVRFSHIIDPDTGKPIKHNLVSVTVIHPSSMTADGLSTLLMVLGEEDGLAFAEKHQLAAYFISKSEHGFTEQFTVKFKQYLK